MLGNLYETCIIHVGSRTACMVEEEVRVALPSVLRAIAVLTNTILEEENEEAAGRRVLA
jgi:hypothetical protein